MPSRKRKGSTSHKIAHRKIQAMLTILRPAVYYRYTKEGGCTFIQDHSGAPMNLPTELIRCLAEHRAKWNVLIAVLCVDNDGNPYLRSEEITSKEPRTQAELAAFLNEEHTRLIAGGNKKHLRDVAWLASPIGTTWTEEKAFNIFMNEFDWSQLPEITTDDEIRYLMNQQNEAA